MSTCPTKDLLSVYLDNELPEIYKAEYEAHIKSCPKCSKELEKLKALRVLFQADSKAVTPDSHYLEQSYERLMIKMKYSKVSESSKNIISSKDSTLPASSSIGVSQVIVFAKSSISFLMFIPSFTKYFRNTFCDFCNQSTCGDA